jgi:hypothetical protein
VTLLYSVALLVSAALLFVIEPMMGKFVLPLLGSSPEVWPTTVLFFQAVLLAGYGFAHLTSRLPARRQALLQLGVLLLALVVLPIGVPDADAPNSEHPIPWLLGLLAVTAGLPFFALAANGPMVQRWLSTTRHQAARDPYFLFAASNGGSLLGLLAYPLLLEPLLTLDEQGEVWSVAYVVGCALVAASALVLWLQPAAEQGPPGPAPEAAPSPVAWRRRLLWLALAAVPSSLMLGTTTYLTRDVSPVPFLWVAPLALYLLTFVVAFSPWTNAERLTVWGRRLLPLAAILVAYTLLIGAEGPLGALLPVHLGGLFVAGLLCHGRLAADRPGTEHLTEFYLWVALGGALGGAFNAVVAPLVFPVLVEYPLAIVAACMLRPAPPKTRPDFLEFFLRDARPTRWLDVGAPLLLAAVIALILVLGRDPDGSVPFDVVGTVAGLSCGLILNFSRRPVRFGLALGAIFLTLAVVDTDGEDVLARDRSFFGIYRVVNAEDNVHELYSGTTLHGAERVGPGPPEPLSYFTRTGPAGQAFAGLPPASIRRVATIGLGSGSLACLAPRGGEFTFFEIDPAVIRFARDPNLFTFLRDCPVRPDVVTGDGRRSLESEASATFGLVVIDAFNSDAIPVHLITRDAVELYLSRTAPGGVLLFHVSNRYLDLEPVLGNIADDLELACRFQSHAPTDPEKDRGHEPSDWVLLARSAGDLGGVGLDGRWSACATDGTAETWTDDYSNPLAILEWG